MPSPLNQSNQSISSVTIGRDGASGRFLPGNHCGGNPAAGRIAALRGEVLQAVNATDIRRALAELFRLGVDEGNVSALVAWLGYVLGRPKEGGLREEALRSPGVEHALSTVDMTRLSDAELRAIIAENRINRVVSGQ